MTIIKFFVIIILFIIINIIKSSNIRTGLLQIQDLTWPFNNETLYWKGNEQFTLTRQFAGMTEGGYWFAANKFCAGEHGGTHCDAPYHVNDTKWKIGDIPIENLITNGAVIDLSDDVLKNGSYTTLQPYHLDNWIVKYGQFQYNTMLLVRFNWSKYWPNRTAFFGSDSMDEFGHPSYPGFSPEAAQWIANNGNIVGIGLDAPDTDPGQTTDYLAHRALAEKNIYMCEQVKMLHKLPPKGFTILVMIMNIEEGTAAPARIIAIPTIK